MITVLGLDSAPNRTGWAKIIESGADGRPRVVERGVLAKMDGHQMSEFLRARACPIVAVEGAFMGMNVRVHEELCRYVGRWEACAELLGQRVRIVKADQWQMGVLYGLITKKSKREARKLAAQQWCEATYGILATEDEADAVGLATWVLRNLLLKAKARR